MDIYLVKKATIAFGLALALSGTHPGNCFANSDVTLTAQAAELADRIAGFGGSDRELTDMIDDALRPMAGSGVDSFSQHLLQSGFVERQCSSPVRCFILRVTRGSKTKVVNVLFVNNDEQKIGKVGFAITSRTVEE